MEELLWKTTSETDRKLLERALSEPEVLLCLRDQFSYWGKHSEADEAARYTVMYLKRVFGIAC